MRSWLALVLDDLDTFRYAFPTPDGQDPVVNRVSPANTSPRPPVNHRNVGGRR